jgi:hypothetical protein
MDIGSIFLILTLAVVVVIFIARSFLEPGIENQKLIAVPVAQEREHQWSELLAERDRLLSSIEELDADYGLGKIAGEDYHVQREELVMAGADVLRQIDAVKLERSRSTLGREQTSAPDDELEALISARRSKAAQSNTCFCSQCGNILKPDDIFCPQCGTKVR